MFKEVWDVVGKYVIAIGIVIICLVLLFYGLKGPSSKYFQSVLDSYIEKYRIEYVNNMEIKNKELQEKEKQLSALTIQLRTSQLAYVATKKELDILKKEVTDINEPKDVKEIKARLKTLGYTVK